MITTTGDPVESGGPVAPLAVFGSSWFSSSIPTPLHSGHRLVSALPPVPGVRNPISQMHSSRWGVSGLSAPSVVGESGLGFAAVSVLFAISPVIDVSVAPVFSGISLSRSTLIDLDARVLRRGSSPMLARGVTAPSASCIVDPLIFAGVGATVSTVLEQSPVPLVSSCPS